MTDIGTHWFGDGCDGGHMDDKRTLCTCGAPGTRLSVLAGRYLCEPCYLDLFPGADTTTGDTE